MPRPDKDIARPAATGKPAAEDDALVYRVPDRPPPESSVTVDHRDGSFTYRPRRDGEDPERL
jgi:hypothetical protein